MKKIFLVLGLGLAMLSSSTFAHNLQIDQLLPAVKVSDYGEIVLNGRILHSNLGHLLRCLEK